MTFSGDVSALATAIGARIKRVITGVRSQTAITGGGTITVNGTGYIKWSARFIIISVGKGSHATANGYVEILLPAAGTTVTGVGGASNKTVTVDGIPLGPWDALFYILPAGGGDGTGGTVANFRVVNYIADVVVPDHWVLLAIRNDDQPTMRLGVGRTVAIPSVTTTLDPYPSATVPAHTQDVTTITGSIAAGSSLLPYPIRGGRKDTALNWNTDCLHNGFYTGAPGSTNTPEGASASVEWWYGWTLTHDPALGNLWCSQFVQKMTGPIPGASVIYMRRIAAGSFGPWVETMLTREENKTLYFADQGAIGGGFDWNTITSNGARQVVGWTGANAPVGAYGYGTLEVIQSGSSVTQNYYPHNSGTGGAAFYTRTKFNASDWTAWVQVTTTGTGRFVGRQDTNAVDIGAAGLETANALGYPSLGFHKPGVYAGQIRMIGSSQFQAVNLAGDAYVNFAALTLEAASDVLVQGVSVRDAAGLTIGTVPLARFPVALRNFLATGFGPVVGDTSMANGNMTEIDPVSTDPMGWVENGPCTITTLVFSEQNMMVVHTTGQAMVYQNHPAGRIPVSAGQKWHVEATMAGGGGTYQWRPVMYFYGRDGTFLYSVEGAQNFSTDSGGHGFRNGDIITVPNDDTIYHARIALLFVNAGVDYYVYQVTANRVIPDKRVPSRLREQMLDDAGSVQYSVVSDANNALKSGWYYVAFGSSSRPIGVDDYALEVIAVNTNHISQIAHEYHSNRQFIRARTAGTWSAWAEILTGSHNHDDRYFTESESDARFAGRNYYIADLNATGNFEGAFYTGAATTNQPDPGMYGAGYMTLRGGALGGGGHMIVSNVNTGRTWFRTHNSASWTAWQEIAPASHTHDDRYFTEAEADARFVNVIESGNSAMREVHGLLRWEQTGNAISGSLVIQTNLTFINTMLTLKIRGYNYYIDADVIDLDVGFYTYESYPYFVNHGAVNKGNFPVPQIRLMTRTSDGKIAVVIDSGIGGQWFYPKIVVDGIFGHANTGDDAYYAGWSASIQTSLAAYTPFVATSILSFANAAHTHDLSALTGVASNLQLPVRLSDYVNTGRGQVTNPDLADVSGWNYWSGAGAIGMSDAVLFTIRYGSTYAAQSAFSLNSTSQNQMWRRTLSAGVWTAWTRVIDTAFGDSRYAGSSHSHVPAELTGGVGYVDSRSVATAPNDYNNIGGRMMFKTKSVLGIPDPGGVTFARVWGFRGYGDSTGGDAHEIAYANDGVWHRQGSTTVWGSWVKIVDPTNANVFTNDSRLSDPRTPTAHTHAATDLASGTVPDARLPDRIRASNSVHSIGDCNAATDSGFYYVYNGAGTNLPPGFTQVELVVSAHSPTYVSQLAMSLNSGRSWTRACDTGAWSPWLENAHIGDAPTAHGHAAADITSGVLADARVPVRIQPGASGSIVSDADAAVSNGWYWHSSTTNAPAGITLGGVILVSAYDPSYVFQTYCALRNTGRFWTRSKAADVASGAWSAWVETSRVGHTHLMAEVTDLTTFIKTLLDDTSASAARATLSVPSIADVNAIVAPVSELGYARKEVTASTGNATFGSASGNISGLSCVVTGDGRPVIARVTIPGITHPSGARVYAYLNVLRAGGVLTTIQGRACQTASGAPTDGIEFHVRWPIPTDPLGPGLTSGVTYTFAVGFSCATAGGAALVAGATTPAELQVVRC